MRRLHPATIVVALLPRLKEAIQAAVPLLIGSFASGHGGNHDWIAVFIGAFTGIFAVGTYFTTRFEILPDHISYKTGWLFKKDRRIPLEQIQNVNIRQNLLERLFRVATVNVETAMGNRRDLNLSVLGLPEAERLREELLGGHHVGDATPVAEPIVRLNMHDLLLGAITENHFAQTVIGLLTIGAPVVNFASKYSSKLPEVGTAGVVIVALALLAVGSWLWGAASYFMKYGNFVVRSTEGAFRISYGLLNKVQMAIRPGRIEYLLLTTTLPQRYMQRSNLRVGTASSFGEAGVLAPVALFVDRDVACRGASQIFAGLNIDALTWQPFDSVLYLSRTTRAMVTIAVFAAMAKAVATNGDQATAALAWPVFGVVSALVLARLGSLFLARAENGFAITENAFVVRQGYFHQSISAMPIERIENVAVTQPIWWKKRGAARLGVQAMKHRLHVGAMPESAIKDLLAQWEVQTQLHETRRSQPSALQVPDQALAWLGGTAEIQG